MDATRTAVARIASHSHSPSVKRGDRQQSRGGGAPARTAADDTEFNDSDPSFFSGFGTDTSSKRRRGGDPSGSSTDRAPRMESGMRKELEDRIVANNMFPANKPALSRDEAKARIADIIKQRAQKGGRPGRISEDTGRKERRGDKHRKRH